MKLKKITAAVFIACMAVGTLSLSGCSKTQNQAENHIRYNDTRIKGNTCGNIANLGGVAEYDGKVYYQNGDDNLSIYCSDTNGDNSVKLNDCQSYFINVTDDYIVYVNADDNYHIYKMKPDGSEDTKLNDAQSYYVSVYDNTVYYSNWSDGNKIYSMSLDGSNNNAVNDDQAYYVTVDEGKIYYSNWSDGAKLYSIDTDGSDKLKLADTGCWYVVPDGDWVYYSQWEHTGNSQQDSSEVDENDKFLCRVKKDGSIKEVINEIPCGDINVYKDRIYFTNWLENNIYSMNTDGTDIKKLTDSYGVYLNGAGDKLYFVEYDNDKNVLLKNIAIEGEGK